MASANRATVPVRVAANAENGRSIMTSFLRPAWLSSLFLGLALVLAAPASPAWQARPAVAAPVSEPIVQGLVNELEQRTFAFFWDSASPVNGLIPDHYPGESFSSIAAVGFGLTAYGVGVERGYITRQQAIERTLTTLRFFDTAPQNDSQDDASGYRGFFYHFLDMRSGKRFAHWTELSTVDTTLLLGGVLFAQSYFDRDTPSEHEIRALADRIYRRVDWNWVQVRPPLISMGWTPEGKFIPHDWEGYNEAMLLYVLALGSPSHPVEPEVWSAWTSTYARSWGKFHGEQLLNFGPMFGHQYSHVWIDFRGIRDAWNREHDLDYFQNSRRAVIAQRNYAIANPGRWTGYGANIWGLTASNGPGGMLVEGPRQRRYYGYTARGAGLGYLVDDGTIAPTAAAGSIAFAPELVIPALEEMKRRYGKDIYGSYGFMDAFNPSFHVHTELRTGKVVPMGWVDNVQLGIDQGPIVLMIENWRSGFVWDVMKKNPYIRRGLQRAGFQGGWLETGPTRQ